MALWWLEVCCQQMSQSTRCLPFPLEREGATSRGAGVRSLDLPRPRSGAAERDGLEAHGSRPDLRGGDLDGSGTAGRLLFRRLPAGSGSGDSSSTGGSAGGAADASRASKVSVTSLAGTGAAAALAAAAGAAAAGAAAAGRAAPSSSSVTVVYSELSSSAFSGGVLALGAMLVHDLQGQNKKDRINYICKTTQIQPKQWPSDPTETVQHAR